MKNLIVKEGNRTGLLILGDHKTYHGKIIWDDSKDGPIPDEFKGKERYLKLLNGKLVEDPAAKVVSDNENQAAASMKSARDATLLNFKNFNGSDAGSGDILLKLLEHLDLK